MKEKVTFWKVAVIGVFIFLFGYLAGNIFDFSKLKSLNLEGYQYNALVNIYAPTSNATSCNATSANATSSNATSSRPTSNNTANNTKPAVKPAVAVAPVPVAAPTADQTANNENVSFENNKITATQIQEIRDSTKALNVTLNCDSNSVISSSIFEAIKKSNSKLVLVSGKNKMTFLGSNISQAKDIDFKMSLTEINKNEKLSKFTNSGLLLEFPNNSKLPGNALVSVNIDDQYNSYFSNGVLTVYYYNESTDKLELVANNLKITDNIVEFTINHNSNFILTNSTINEENINSDSTNEVVRFVNNNLIYVIVIAVSILLIITVTVIILIQRKKKFGKIF